MLDRTKNDNIRELAAGKLYALQNLMPLDGRVSSYPGSATGYSVSNCYLLKQPDAAWLIDTGFGGHEPALRAQIDSLIPRTLPLSLLPLRLNEFMSIQNIDPFTLHFNVKECFTGNPDAAFWFDFVNPVHKIGDQIVEMIRSHQDSVEQGGVEERSVELLDLVGIPQPRTRPASTRTNSPAACASG